MAPRAAPPRPGVTGPLAVTEQGRQAPGDPIVVLVHGAMDRARSLRRVVERLPDLLVVSYDRRGYGDSVDAGPPTGLAQHLDDLLGIIAGRRATIVAHSYGSHLAVLAGIARPDLVASVGLWEPPVPWMEFWPAEARRSVARIAAAEDPADVGERGVRSMLGTDGWNRLSDDARALRRAEGYAFVVDMASEVEAPYDWADLHVPCLIGYGDKTWPYSFEASQRLAAIVGCDTFVVESATHTAHVSHPDAFAEFVRRAVALGTAPGG
jgi:pimeloyl-ACP methyl ester carboxylesterase